MFRFHHGGGKKLLLPGKARVTVKEVMYIYRLFFWFCCSVRPSSFWRTIVSMLDCKKVYVYRGRKRRGTSFLEVKPSVNPSATQFLCTARIELVIATVLLIHRTGSILSCTS